MLETRVKIAIVGTAMTQINKKCNKKEKALDAICSDKPVLRNDIILIIVFIAIAAVLFAKNSLFHNEIGASVQITVDSIIYKTLPLDEDTSITIAGYDNGSNALQIKDGYASIISADCPDKLCQKQKKIRYNGETLVCLPHRVIVSVISKEDKDIDSIAY